MCVEITRFALELCVECEGGVRGDQGFFAPENGTVKLPFTEMRSAVLDMLSLGNHWICWWQGQVGSWL